MNKIIILLAGALFMACSPKVYVIDRQTVLEDESVGDWPKLFEHYNLGFERPTPNPYETIPTSKSESRLYSILNGSL